MRRIFNEAVVLLGVLALVAVLIGGYTQVAMAPARYDTFTGRVNKVPLQISSPVFGQLLSLPLAVGSPVVQGQVVATIQVLDRNFRLPADSQLFKLQGQTLSVVSPASGVVARVNVAPLSTVSGNEKLVDLYTTASTDVWMLLPQGNDLSAYGAFYVTLGASKLNHRLFIEGLIPSDLVTGAPPTTNVYRARCEDLAGCPELLINQQVTICAEKVAPKPSIASLPQISWLSPGARQQACGAGS